MTWTWWSGWQCQSQVRPRAHQDANWWRSCLRMRARRSSARWPPAQDVLACSSEFNRSDVSSQQRGRRAGGTSPALFLEDAGIHRGASGSSESVQPSSVNQHQCFWWKGQIRSHHTHEINHTVCEPSCRRWHTHRSTVTFQLLVELQNDTLAF